jgi:hypothetical protein
MKLLNLFESILTEQSDCSNLFTDSADGTLHRMAIGNDLYYYVVKQISVKLELMSPDEFFDALGGYEQHSDIIDRDDVMNKVNTFKSGGKLPIPFLRFNENGGNTGHEGRHRALAAKEMGCQSIPVMVERAVGIDKIMELANMVGHLEESDMIIELKKLGFKSFKNIDHVGIVLRVSKETGKYYVR